MSTDAEVERSDLNEKKPPVVELDKDQGAATCIDESSIISKKIQDEILSIDVGAVDSSEGDVLIVTPDRAQTPSSEDSEGFNSSQHLREKVEALELKSWQDYESDHREISAGDNQTTENELTISYEKPTSSDREALGDELSDKNQENPTLLSEEEKSNAINAEVIEKNDDCVTVATEKSLEIADEVIMPRHDELVGKEHPEVSQRDITTTTSTEGGLPNIQSDIVISRNNEETCNLSCDENSLSMEAANQHSQENFSKEDHNETQDGHGCEQHCKVSESLDAVDNEATVQSEDNTHPLSINDTAVRENLQDKEVTSGDTEMDINLIEKKVEDKNFVSHSAQVRKETNLEIAAKVEELQATTESHDKDLEHEKITNQDDLSEKASTYIPEALKEQKDELKHEDIPEDANEIDKQCEKKIMETLPETETSLGIDETCEGDESSLTGPSEQQHARSLPSVDSVGNSEQINDEGAPRPEEKFDEVGDRHKVISEESEDAEGVMSAKGEISNASSLVMEEVPQDNDNMHIRNYNNAETNHEYQTSASNHTGDTEDGNKKADGYSDDAHTSEQIAVKLPELSTENSGDPFNTKEAAPDPLILRCGMNKKEIQDVEEPERINEEIIKINAHGIQLKEDTLETLCEMVTDDKALGQTVVPSDDQPDEAVYMMSSHDETIKVHNFNEENELQAKEISSKGIQGDESTETVISENDECACKQETEQDYPHAQLIHDISVVESAQDQEVTSKDTTIDRYITEEKAGDEKSDISCEQLSLELDSETGGTKEDSCAKIEARDTNEMVTERVPSDDPELLQVQKYELDQESIIDVNKIQKDSEKSKIEGTPDTGLSPERNEDNEDRDLTAAEVSKQQHALEISTAESEKNSNPINDESASGSGETFEKTDDKPEDSTDSISVREATESFNVAEEDMLEENSVNIEDIIQENDKMDKNHDHKANRTNEQQNNISENIIMESEENEKENKDSGDARSSDNLVAKPGIFSSEDLHDVPLDSINDSKEGLEIKVAEKDFHLLPEHCSDVSTNNENPEVEISQDPFDTKEATFSHPNENFGTNNEDTQGDAELEEDNKEIMQRNENDLRVKEEEHEAAGDLVTDEATSTNINVETIIPSDDQPLEAPIQNSNEEQTGKDNNNGENELDAKGISDEGFKENESNEMQNSIPANDEHKIKQGNLQDQSHDLPINNTSVGETMQDKEVASKDIEKGSTLTEEVADKSSEAPNAEVKNETNSKADGRNAEDFQETAEGHDINLNHGEKGQYDEMLERVAADNAEVLQVQNGELEHEDSVEDNTKIVKHREKDEIQGVCDAEASTGGTNGTNEPASDLSTVDSKNDADQWGDDGTSEPREKLEETRENLDSSSNGISVKGKEIVHVMVAEEEILQQSSINVDDFSQDNDKLHDNYDKDAKKIHQCQNEANEGDDLISTETSDNQHASSLSSAHSETDTDPLTNEGASGYRNEFEETIDQLNGSSNVISMEGVVTESAGVAEEMLQESSVNTGSVPQDYEKLYKNNDKDAKEINEMQNSIPANDEHKDKQGNLQDQSHDLPIRDILVGETLQDKEVASRDIKTGSMLTEEVADKSSEAPNTDAKNETSSKTDGINAEGFQETTEGHDIKLNHGEKGQYDEMSERVATDNAEELQVQKDELQHEDNVEDTTKIVKHHEKDETQGICDAEESSDGTNGTNEGDGLPLAEASETEPASDMSTVDFKNDSDQWGDDGASEPREKFEETKENLDSSSKDISVKGEEIVHVKVTEEEILQQSSVNADDVPQDNDKLHDNNDKDAKKIHQCQNETNEGDALTFTGALDEQHASDLSATASQNDTDPLSDEGASKPGEKFDETSDKLNGPSNDLSVEGETTGRVMVTEEEMVQESSVNTDNVPQDNDNPYSNIDSDVKEIHECQNKTNGGDVLTFSGASDQHASGILSVDLKNDINQLSDEGISEPRERFQETSDKLDGSSNDISVKGEVVTESIVVSEEEMLHESSVYANANPQYNDELYNKNNNDVEGIHEYQNETNEGGDLTSTETSDNQHASRLSSADSETDTDPLANERASGPGKQFEETIDKLDGSSNVISIEGVVTESVVVPEEMLQESSVNTGSVPQDNDELYNNHDKDTKEIHEYQNEISEGNESTSTGASHQQHASGLASVDSKNDTEQLSNEGTWGPGEKFEETGELPQEISVSTNNVPQDKHKLDNNNDKDAEEINEYQYSISTIIHKEAEDENMEVQEDSGEPFSPKEATVDPLNQTFDSNNEDTQEATELEEANEKSIKSNEHDIQVKEEAFESTSDLISNKEELSEISMEENVPSDDQPGDTEPAINSVEKQSQIHNFEENELKSKGTSEEGIQENKIKETLNGSLENDEPKDKQEKVQNQTYDLLIHNASVGGTIQDREVADIDGTLIKKVEEESSKALDSKMRNETKSEDLQEVTEVVVNLSQGEPSRQDEVLLERAADNPEILEVQEDQLEYKYNVEDANKIQNHCEKIKTEDVPDTAAPTSRNETNKGEDISSTYASEEKQLEPVQSSFDSKIGSGQLSEGASVPGEVETAVELEGSCDSMSTELQNAEIVSAAGDMLLESSINIDSGSQDNDKVYHSNEEAADSSHEYLRTEVENTGNEADDTKEKTRDDSPDFPISDKFVAEPGQTSSEDIMDAKNNNIIHIKKDIEKEEDEKATQSLSANENQDAVASDEGTNVEISANAFSSKEEAVNSLSQTYDSTRESTQESTEVENFHKNVTIIDADFIQVKEELLEAADEKIANEVSSNKNTVFTDQRCRQSDEETLYETNIQISHEGTCIIEDVNQSNKNLDARKHNEHKDESEISSIETLQETIETGEGALTKEYIAEGGDSTQQENIFQTKQDSFEEVSDTVLAANIAVSEDLANNLYQGKASNEITNDIKYIKKDVIFSEAKETSDITNENEMHSNSPEITSDEILEIMNVTNECASTGINTEQGSLAKQESPNEVNEDLFSSTCDRAMRTSIAGSASTLNVKEGQINSMQDDKQEEDAEENYGDFEENEDHGISYTNNSSNETTVDCTSKKHEEFCNLDESVNVLPVVTEFPKENVQTTDSVHGDDKHSAKQDPESQHAEEVSNSVIMEQHHGKIVDREILINESIEGTDTEKNIGILSSTEKLARASIRIAEETEVPEESIYDDLKEKFDTTSDIHIHAVAENDSMGKSKKVKENNCEDEEVDEIIAAEKLEEQEEEQENRNEMKQEKQEELNSVSKDASSNDRRDEGNEEISNSTIKDVEGQKKEDDDYINSNYEERASITLQKEPAVGEFDHEAASANLTENQIEHVTKADQVMSNESLNLEDGAKEHTEEPETSPIHDMKDQEGRALPAMSDDLVNDIATVTGGEPAIEPLQFMSRDGSLENEKLQKDCIVEKKETIEEQSEKEEQLTESSLEVFDHESSEIEKEQQTDLDDLPVSRYLMDHILQKDGQNHDKDCNVGPKEMLGNESMHDEFQKKGISEDESNLKPIPVMQDPSVSEGTCSLKPGDIDLLTSTEDTLADHYPSSESNLCEKPAPSPSKHFKDEVSNLSSDFLVHEVPSKNTEAERENSLEVMGVKSTEDAKKSNSVHDDQMPSTVSQMLTESTMEEDNGDLKKEIDVSLVSITTEKDISSKEGREEGLGTPEIVEDNSETPAAILESPKDKDSLQPGDLDLQTSTKDTLAEQYPSSESKLSEKLAASVSKDSDDAVPSKYMEPEREESLEVVDAVDTEDAKKPEHVHDERMSLTVPQMLTENTLKEDSGGLKEKIDVSLEPRTSEKIISSKEAEEEGLETQKVVEEISETPTAILTEKAPPITETNVHAKFINPAEACRLNTLGEELKNESQDSESNVHEQPATVSEGKDSNDEASNLSPELLHHIVPCEITQSEIAKPLKNATAIAIEDSRKSDHDQDTLCFDSSQKLTESIPQDDNGIQNKDNNILQTSEASAAKSISPKESREILKTVETGKEIDETTVATTPTFDAERDAKVLKPIQSQANAPDQSITISSMRQEVKDREEPEETIVESKVNVKKKLDEEFEACESEKTQPIDIKKNQAVELNEQHFEGKDPTANQLQKPIIETKDFRVEEEILDEHKDEDKEQDEHETEGDKHHLDQTKDTKDADPKSAHKKSHNILSGVGSKVKNSIAKVKKAITGKSSHSKTVSPK